MGKSGFALAMAGVLAALAFVGMRKLIREEKQTIAEKIEPWPVVVAGRPLRGGDSLMLSNTKTVPIPHRFVTKGMITAGDLTSYMGRTVVRPIEEGRLIFDTDLGVPGMAAEEVPVDKGMRSVTVAVDEVSGVAGLIGPRDRVDVLVTISMPGSRDSQGQDRPVTRLLLSNLLVRQVGAGESVLSRRRPDGHGREYTTVTIVVTPREAQVLSFAQAKGKITLLLRPPLDGGEVEALPEVDVRNLFEESREALKLRHDAVRGSIKSE